MTSGTIKMLYTAAIGLLILACTKEEPYVPPPMMKEDITMVVEPPTEPITTFMEYTILNTLDDGKGTITHNIEINDHIDGRIALGYKIEGDVWRPIFESLRTAQIEEGQTITITYVFTETINIGDIEVVFETEPNYGLNQGFKTRTIDAITEMVNLLGENNYTQKITVINYSQAGETVWFGGLAANTEYFIISAVSDDLYTHLHESGHNFHHTSGRVNNDIVRDLQDNHFITDYGATAFNEYFAEAFAFHFLGNNLPKEVTNYLLTILN